MSTPTISVIVPVFNVENYLVTLLDSLLNQTEKSIEIIAVNDGSTDTSGKILLDTCERDSRLVVINKQNGGQSSARNLGLKFARGKWIAFADSDDWLHPSALETWLKQAEEQNLDFLLGNRYRFINDPVAEFSYENLLLKLEPWNKVITGVDWITRCVEPNNKWPHPAWIQFLSGDLVRNNNLQFKEGIVHEDMLWTFNLALCAQRVGYCPTPYYGYRRTIGSIMNCKLQKTYIHRAESLIAIFYDMLNSSTRSDRKVISKIVSRIIIIELDRVMLIIRKRIADHQEKYNLAKNLLKPELMLLMLQGVTNIRELWLTIHSWISLYKIIFQARARRVSAYKND